MRWSWIILALVGLSGGGCATVYVPTGAANPVTVYLTDYGVHSSLIMPNGDGKYVEYSWGDWHYDLTRTALPWDMLYAMFFSSSSGLGRRYLEVDGQGVPVIPANTTPHLLRMTAVQVNGEATQRLVAHMDARFRGDHPPGIVNPVNQNIYVIDDEHYSVFHNCNSLTASCLRALDCQVRGWPMISGFVVIQGDVPVVMPKPWSPKGK